MLRVRLPGRRQLGERGDRASGWRDPARRSARRPPPRRTARGDRRTRIPGNGRTRPSKPARSPVAQVEDRLEDRDQRTGCRDPATSPRARRPGDRSRRGVALGRRRPRRTSGHASCRTAAPPRPRGRASRGLEAVPGTFEMPAVNDHGSAPGLLRRPLTCWRSSAVARIRRTTRYAPSAIEPGSRTANSSPPIRKTRSVRRSPAVSRPADPDEDPVAAGMAPPR